ncbi:hypothetical protein [Corynebacterium variabile]|uniref:hypothetical protein n=1 Tax=Corynebacterium variabile TaxID=1727 RepID=UPI003A916822
MTTVVVATFAILILTGCSGDSGESGDAATAGKGMLSRTTGHGIAENTVEVLPPDSLAPGMEMTELREYLESSGMSDRWVDEAVDAMVTGDYAAMESLSLQQYMGEPDGRTTPFADGVLESLRRSLPTADRGVTAARGSPGSGTPPPAQVSRGSGR